MKQILFLVSVVTLFVLLFVQKAESQNQTQNQTSYQSPQAQKIQIKQTRYQELTQKQIREIKRDQRQQIRAAEGLKEYQAAIQALNDKNWVLMATTLYTPMGNSIFVSDNTNFIQFKDNTVYVQLAFNGIAGPNGLGGITIKGYPSQISYTSDKQGNITYSFYVNSFTLTAQIIVSLNADNNFAYATVYPMTNSNNLTFSGTLVPTSQAGIFRSGFISF